MSPQPSLELLEHWVASLAAHRPFARMERGHVQQLALAAHERYFPPDAVIIAPVGRVPEHLIFLREGRVLGQRASPGQAQDAFELDRGSLFPVAALLAGRPLGSTYTALADCFCLFIPWSAASALMASSPSWADFLNQRMLAFLEATRQRWRQELLCQVPQQLNLETRIAELPQRQPISRPAHAPLSEVLALMHEHKSGSVLLTGQQGALSGILTRNDVLDRGDAGRAAAAHPGLAGHESARVDHRGRSHRF